MGYGSSSENWSCCKTSFNQTNWIHGPAKLARVKHWKINWEKFHLTLTETLVNRNNLNMREINYKLSCCFNLYPSFISLISQKLNPNSHSWEKPSKNWELNAYPFSLFCLSHYSQIYEEIRSFTPITISMLWVLFGVATTN